MTKRRTRWQGVYAAFHPLALERSPRLTAVSESGFGAPPRRAQNQATAGTTPSDAGDRCEITAAAAYATLSPLFRQRGFFYAHLSPFFAIATN